MKKLLFMSATFLGISFSLVQASNSSFLDQIQKQLFFGQTFNTLEKEKLLNLSSEAPRFHFAEDRSLVQDKNEVVERSENTKVGNIKKPVKIQKRRKYSHFNKLVKPIPFYQQQKERIINEPSINIVRRKNQSAQRKLERYRTIFPAYGN